MQTSRSKEPAAFRAVACPLYPTLDSLQQVYDLADSSLPILTKNSLRALMMTLQNTLIKQMSH